MSGFVLALRSLALLIARIGLGGILILQGWRRWQVDGVLATITYLRRYGTPYPEVAAWSAVTLEVVGGVFLIVGALTPLIALGVLVQQILSIAYIRWYRGPYLTEPGGLYRGGYEYALALGLVAMLLMVFGAGSLSVDRLFRRNDDYVREVNDADAP